MNDDKTWRVERHDPTWGGWRPVAKGFDDDSPAEFPSKNAADRARRTLARDSVYQYRTVEAGR